MIARRVIAPWFLAAVLLSGCSAAIDRKTTMGKIFTMFAQINPLRGAVEAAVTLFVLLGVLVVLDECLGGGKDRARKDPPDDR